MEFQAYPKTTPCRKDQNIFLKVQNILHSSDSVILPCSLLAMGSILLGYQHMTSNETGRHSMRNFLAKILISMIPLAFLERKILQSSDPVGLFAKFSAKVLLMHTCFLGLRVAASLLYPDVSVGYVSANALALLGACILLPTVFRLRPSIASFVEHRDVWCLAAVTIMLAVLEVKLLSRYSFHIMWQRDLFIEDIILTSSDYLEILSFVPAVWMACRKDIDMPWFELRDSQRRAVCLFAFLTAFYSVEDLVNAYGLSKGYRLAMCAHLAHFTLLMDFSAFLLAHLYDPEKFEKLRGSFYSWISDACAV